MGMPCSRLLARPRRNSRSAARAWRNAGSASTVRNAFTMEFARSMRCSAASTNSTGDTSRRRSRRAASSIDRNANSASERRFVMRASENFLLSPYVSNRAKVGAADHHAVLIFIADIAERKPPVLEADATAVPVVGELGDLILEQGLAEIVTRAEVYIPSAPVQITPAEERAHLIGSLPEIGRGRRRFQRQIQHRKMRQGDERRLVRFQLQQRADRGGAVAVRVVVDDELRVVTAPRLHAQVADDGRKMPRLIGERKRRKLVEGFEYIRLPGRERAAKGRIKKIF